MSKQETQSPVLGQKPVRFTHAQEPRGDFDWDRNPKRRLGTYQIVFVALLVLAAVVALFYAPAFFR